MVANRRLRKAVKLANHTIARLLWHHVLIDQDEWLFVLVLGKQVLWADLVLEFRYLHLTLADHVSIIGDLLLNLVKTHLAWLYLHEQFSLLVCCWQPFEHVFALTVCSLAVRHWWRINNSFRPNIRQFAVNEVLDSSAHPISLLLKIAKLCDITAERICADHRVKWPHSHLRTRCKQVAFNRGSDRRIVIILYWCEEFAQALLLMVVVLVHTVKIIASCEGRHLASTRVIIPVGVWHGCVLSHMHWDLILCLWSFDGLFLDFARRLFMLVMPVGGETQLRLEIGEVLLQMFV